MPIDVQLEKQIDEAVVAIHHISPYENDSRDAKNRRGVKNRLENPSDFLVFYREKPNGQAKGDEYDERNADEREQSRVLKAVKKIASEGLFGENGDVIVESDELHLVDEIRFIKGKDDAVEERENDENREEQQMGQQEKPRGKAFAQRLSNLADAQVFDFPDNHNFFARLAASSALFLIIAFISSSL